MADLTEKRHDSVKRTIDTLSANGVISHPQIVAGDKAANGVIESVYQINKRDSYIIVAQLSPEFTARLVDRWQELEAAIPAPAELSRLELLQIAMQSETERLALAEKIALDAPKVAFAEAIRAIDGVCHIEKIAKTLGLGRNKFFKRLRDDSILMGNNLPYQRFLDKEYFTVNEQEPFTDSKGVQHPTFTAMVTGAGQVFLTRKYSEACRKAA